MGVWTTQGSCPPVSPRWQCGELRSKGDNLLLREHYCRDCFFSCELRPWKKWVLIFKFSGDSKVEVGPRPHLLQLTERGTGPDQVDPGSGHLLPGSSHRCGLERPLLLGRSSAAVCTLPTLPVEP